MSIIKAVLTVLFLSAFASVEVNAQDRIDFGDRPLRNFEPTDYDQDRQNWTIAEDDSGLLYFGNRDGVLEFDGVSWNLIPATNGTTVRCLVNHDSVVYVGGKSDFGYLDQLEGWAPLYKSLADSSQLGDFADVWSCNSSGTLVFFQSSETIFILEDGSITSHSKADITGSTEKSGSLYVMMKFQDDIFVSIAAGGKLYRFSESRFEEVPGSDQIPSTIVGLLPHPEHGMLALTFGDGLLTYNDGRFSKLTTKAETFFANNEMYDGIALSNGNYALASTSGGVIVIDPQGNLLWSVDESNGLGSDSVYDLIEDRNGNIWMASEYGISISEASSPYSIIGKSRGLKGVPNKIAVFEEQLFVSTSTALFGLQSGQNDLRLLNEGRHAGLVPMGEELIVGTYGDLLSYRQGRFEKISTERLFILSMLRSGSNPNRILIGTINGLVSFRRENGNWIAEGYLAKVKGDVTSIVEDSGSGDILIGTEFRGAIRVQADFENFENHKVIPIATGTPEGDQSPVTLVEIDGKPRVITYSGMFLLQENELKKDDTFNTFESGLSTHLEDITENLGGIWATTKKDGLFKLIYNANDNEYIVDGSFLSDQRINSIESASDGTIRILGDNQIILLDESKSPEDFDFKVVLRQIEDIRTDSTLYFGSVNSDSSPGLELPYSRNSLRFRTANLGYDTSLSSYYRFRLEGADDDYSSWSSESWKDYTNLEPGKYVLAVQGRNRRSLNDSETKISITIKPPWYRSVWAYILYSLLALGLVLLALSLVRRQILERERKRSFHELSKAHTDLQESHDSLRRTQDQLLHAEKLASMGQLTAGIAHEIKNPLNFINNFVQLNSELLTELKQDLVDNKENKVGDVISELSDTIDNLKENSTIINKHGQRADRVVQSMMEHARGGKGEFSKVDVNEFVEEYTHLAYFALKSKKEGLNIDLIQDLDPACASAVLMTQELGQVIINLLNNAYDAVVQRAAAGDGGYKPTISIETKASSDNSNFEILVKDNGTGMSEQVKSRIFEPFYTTKSAGEGTGLGLSLSRDIITLGHSGQILVDSTIGEGTTFTISIPRVDTIEEALRERPKE